MPAVPAGVIASEGTVVELTDTFGDLTRWADVPWDVARLGARRVVDETAATKAISANVTASTAHQCGLCAARRASSFGGSVAPPTAPTVKR